MSFDRPRPSLTPSRRPAFDPETGTCCCSVGVGAVWSIQSPRPSICAAITPPMVMKQQCAVRCGAVWCGVPCSRVCARGGLMSWVPTGLPAAAAVCVQRSVLLFSQRDSRGPLVVRPVPQLLPHLRCTSREAQLANALDTDDCPMPQAYITNGVCQLSCTTHEPRRSTR